MHFKNLSQKIAKMSALTVAGIIAGVMFTPTDTFGALPKKKLEIIIGGDNFCKDNKDCAGDSFCNMTSHICIICPKPFEWVGGTQCVCPSGTVPNADNTDCVECMTDSNCQDLKGNLHWVCDTDTNTCACMSGLHEESGQCVCNQANKTPDEDGNCICQLSQADCPTSDFTGTNDCKCCPADTPKWDGLECRTCADVNRTKPYYNPSSHTCVECLTDAQCTDGVCIDNVCYPCREDRDCAGNKVCQNKQCVCKMTSTDCPTSDFTGTNDCKCCPADKPKWDASTSTCKTCADVDASKPYHNLATNTCEECLTDAHCGLGAYCDAVSNVCRCSGIKEYRQDIGEKGPTCQCPLDTPAEADPDTCECPANMDMVYETVDGKTVKKCVVSCPSNTGFTGLRDRETNICQCDTSLGFKPDAEGEMCVCDETKDYFPTPTGGCTKCEAMTAKFCHSVYDGNENETRDYVSHDVQCSSMDGTSWYCGGYYKFGPTDRWQMWNPSTKSYCNEWQVLRKIGDKFVCGTCDEHGLHYRLYEVEGRTDDFGHCACRGTHYNYDTATKTCRRVGCNGDKNKTPYPQTGQCSTCTMGEVTADGITCYAYTSQYSCGSSLGAFSTYYWWGWWYKESRKKGCTRSWPTLDKSDGVCGFHLGCFYNADNLALCDMNALITSDCRCPTATTNNRYCCASTSYEAANGCVACTGGSVPNANKDGCEVCKDNTVAKDGKCIPCEKGYYPNVSHSRCLACPTGTTTDEKGLSCIAVENEEAI